MNYKLMKGRPENESERLLKEIKVYDYLERINMEYRRMDHEPLMSMEACEQAEKAMEGGVIAKNLLLCNRQKTSYYLLMMPGEKKFVTKDLSAQINSARLSFASGEDMERLLDITPGSLSVTGLINDTEGEITLLIDKDLLENEELGIHPSINTSTLSVKTKDLLEVFIPSTKHEPIIVNL